MNTKQAGNSLTDFQYCISNNSAYNIEERQHTSTFETQVTTHTVQRQSRTY